MQPKEDLDSVSNSCSPSHYVSPKLISYRLWAKHPRWQGNVYLFNDGTMSRPNGDGGQYFLKLSSHLALKWDRWREEYLHWNEDANAFCSGDNLYSVYFCSNHVATIKCSEYHRTSKFERCPPNVTWSRTLGLAYFPIPKNACTSTKTALLKTLNLNIPEGTPLHARCPSHCPVRLEPNSIDFSPIPDTFDSSSLLTFAVIRHPLDRLVSCYANKIAQRRQGLPAPYTSAQSFEEFVQLVSNDVFANPHFAPQFSMLPEILDFTIRFDNLKTDWGRLRAHSPMLGKIPHHNRSSHRPWQNYYSPRTRRSVENLYAEDLRLYHQRDS